MNNILAVRGCTARYRQVPSRPRWVLWPLGTSTPHCSSCTNASTRSVSCPTSPVRRAACSARCGGSSTPKGASSRSWDRSGCQPRKASSRTFPTSRGGPSHGRPSRPSPPSQHPARHRLPPRKRNRCHQRPRRQRRPNPLPCRRRRPPSRRRAPPRPPRPPPPPAPPPPGPATVTPPAPREPAVPAPPSAAPPATLPPGPTRVTPVPAPAEAVASRAPRPAVQPAANQLAAETDWARRHPEGRVTRVG
jgi:hypothetical protein